MALKIFSRCLTLTLLTSLHTALTTATPAKINDNTQNHGNALALAPRADDPRLPPSTSCRLPYDTNNILSAGFLNNDTIKSLGCVPGSGIVKALLLFVDFPDAKSPDGETTQDLFRQFFTEMNEWFKGASWYNVNFDVFADMGFHRMPQDSSSYKLDTDSTTPNTDAELAYVTDAMTTFLSAPLGTEWLANATAAAGLKGPPDDPTVTPPLIDLLFIIPTKANTAIQHTGTAWYDVYTPDQKYRLAHKALYVGRDAYDVWNYRIIVHKVGFAMCLAPMFPAQEGQSPYVGPWDVMGAPLAKGSDFFAWNKWRLGWLDDQYVSCVDWAAVQAAGTAFKTTFTVSGLGWNPQAGSADARKAVVIKLMEGSAIVLEDRTFSDQDKEICVEGVLMYNVNTDLAMYSGQFQVVDATPNSKGCADGDELSDAPLTMKGPTEFKFEGPKLTVTLVGSGGDGYQVEVRYDP